MSVLEVILIALAAVAVLATLAERFAVPYPVLLVPGGIALGYLPGVPRVTFPPNLTFLLFMPPLVFSTAWRASWPEFRANLRPISSLAVGLVLTTMAVVAAVAHGLLAGMTWPVAFVLGAVVSTTDPAGVSAVVQRVHVPRHLVTVLEGESLGNDAASLVSYRLAVAAVVAGVFSLGSAVAQFAFATVAGVAIGLAVGRLYAWLQRRLDSPSVEVTITLLLPFVAYIPADRVGASGVLAVVAAGLYAGHRDPEIRSAETRLQALAFWDTLVFVLNGLIFILLGLQLPIVVGGVAHQPVAVLARDAAIVTLAVVLVRVLWTVGVTNLLWVLRRATGLPIRPAKWIEVPVVAWAGVRGADTLVVALAVPLATSTGGPFPDRALLIFLTFCVIVTTLLAEGLSLPYVIRWAGLPRDDAAAELARAHAAAHTAAAARIEEQARVGSLPPGAANLRRYHERRARQYAARASGDAPPGAPRGESLRQLRQDVVAAARQAVLEMRDRGEISEDATRAVLHDLDLEEEQIE